VAQTCNLVLPRHKCETLFKKYVKEKGLGMWLKW
jgi:hypothetical protein